MQTRNTELRKTIKNIPLTKLMIETDCPYLIPKNLPNKPKNNRNEPYNLNHIVAEISMLMDIGEDIPFKNTKKFFLKKSKSKFKSNLNVLSSEYRYFSFKFF